MSRSRHAALAAAVLALTLAACAGGSDARPGERAARAGSMAAPSPTPSTPPLPPSAADSPVPDPPPPRTGPAAPAPPLPWGAGCPDAATLSPRAQLAQLLFLGVDGSSVQAVRNLAGADPPVGGVFVGGNSATVFTSGVLRELRTAAIPPLVAVDDEGGRVQRIEAIAGDLPSARTLGQETPARLREISEQRGRQLADVGVTMDFAPVVDLGGQSAGSVIGDRAYGHDAAAVLVAAGAVAAGLRSAGILPTLKHFPGHGRADGDSHLGEATTPDWSELQRSDVLPYRNLPSEGAVAVMMGHLIVPGLSSAGVPTSLDPEAYRALREVAGFGGLVVTDDLSGMRAVSAAYGPAEAAQRALHAGADMALLTGAVVLPEVLDTLAGEVAAGRLSPERVRDAANAVLAVKHCN